MNEAADLAGIQAVLDELGQELEVELALDDEGSCYVDYQGGLPLSIVADTPTGLVVAANVGGRDDIPAEVLADVLAEFNWLGRATRGAALAFNPERGRFVLWSSQPLEKADVDGVRGQMENLIRAALEVGPRLEERLSGDDLRSDPGDDPPEDRPGARRKMTDRV